MQHFTPYNESFPFKTLMHLLPQILRFSAFISWSGWPIWNLSTFLHHDIKQLPDELAIAALNFPLSHPWLVPASAFAAENCISIYIYIYLFLTIPCTGAEHRHILYCLVQLTKRILICTLQITASITGMQLKTARSPRSSMCRVGSDCRNSPDAAVPRGPCGLMEWVIIFLDFQIPAALVWHQQDSLSKNKIRTKRIWSFVQHQANAVANTMPSVGPTPFNCHEPTAVGLACSVSQEIEISSYKHNIFN